MRRGLVSEVFVTEAAMARFGGMLADVPVHQVTERAAKALSDTVTPVGLVAVCSVPETDLDDVLARELHSHGFGRLILNILRMSIDLP